MIELAPQIEDLPEPPRPAAIDVHVLGPDDRLPIDGAEHTLSVSDGVLHVVLEDDELALTPGDQIGLRSGELRRAWNAGEDAARVVVMSRPHLVC
jgi:glyoxylate utilization-related uncharacterized protein